MIRIFNLTGIYLFFYFNNMVHYFFSKDSFYLYSSTLHISICLFNILNFEKDKTFIFSKNKIDFIINLFLRIASILSSLIFIIGNTDMKKIELIILILSLIIYSLISLMWLIIHIYIFIKIKKGENYYEFKNRRFSRNKRL